MPFLREFPIKDWLYFIQRGRQRVLSENLSLVKQVESWCSEKTAEDVGLTLQGMIEIERQRLATRLIAHAAKDEDVNVYTIKIGSDSDEQAEKAIDEYYKSMRNL